ncbi:MAG: hypothetical protein ABIW85_06945 [Variovorax sp.]
MAISIAIVLTLARFGATEALGAHPFWAFKITWLAILPAIAIWWLVRRWRWPEVAFGLGLAGAALAAVIGKNRFAASFAEDTLAGRFWFVGWIAIAAFATGLIAVLFERAARPPGAPSGL